MGPEWINLFLLSFMLYETSANKEKYEKSTSGENKRQVKLYSDERPKPIVCIKEGFQEDPNDCSAFHRCIKLRNGRYFSYKFQCGPGTVYDPDTEACNHPHSTKRSECSVHFRIIADSIQNNEIIHELPSPISTKSPVYNDIMTTKGTFIKNRQQSNNLKNPLKPTNSLQEGIYLKPQSTNEDETYTPREIVFNNRPSVYKDGEKCILEGFMGDIENCQKFYRCVSNRRGGFIRYEFLCSDTTIWDDDKQACNHIELVKKRRCGRDNKIEKEATNSNYENTTIQVLMQINYGTKLTTKNVNHSKLSNMTEHQTSLPYDLAFSQNQVSYGNKSNSTQTSNNKPSRWQSQSVKNTTDRSAMQKYGNDCTETGFMGDPKNCKLFYRCVNNGRGSFTRYEFSCGEGTVWDPKIESCNHVWAVKECGDSSYVSQSSQATVKTTQKTTTNIFTTSSTNKYYSSDMPSVDENYDNGYQNQIPSFSTSTPTEVILTTTKKPVSTANSRCHLNGFMGDSADCKKFYRCVDNGYGQYTRYEFVCGEGTVWDPKIEACNHAWAVENCGGSNDILKGNSTTSATPISQSTTLSTSQSVSDINDYDIGYGHQTGESSTVVSTTITVITSSIDSQKICRSDGFIGDSENCKKFYRCVSNSNGTFSKYEFSCGEGTVWDPKINACNHAWAVEKCGGTDDGNKIETTTHSMSESTKYISTETYHTDDYNIVGNGQEINSITPPGVSHVGSANVDISKCTSSGFIGDKNDCKIFYRCVDNGNGGYTRFEFTCGEGTIWDSKVQSCNHAWAVDKCGIDNKPHTEPTQLIDEDESQIGYPSQNGETNTDKTPTISNSTTIPTKNICWKSGFMGDPNNCKFFYRCVDDGQGGFIGYEFTCGEGTLWDQSIESCNHAWAVSNCSQFIDHQTTPVLSTTNTGDHDFNQQTTETGLSSSTVLPSQIKCTKEGLYANREDCKKFYRCVNNGQGNFIKSEFTCSDGTFWDQEILACNHDAGQCKSNVHFTSTTMQSVNSTISPENVTTQLQEETNNNICISEGFFANPRDCQQFYRCARNDKNGFTKYDFTCGQGTIWIQEILGCDHDSDMTSCKNVTNSSESAVTSQEQLSSSTSQTPTPLPLPDTDNNNDEYNEGTIEKHLSESELCKANGFFANEKDCTKFYRCVNNGQGGFTKYDFTCGDGTAWDTKIQSCNYINEVGSCNNIQETQTKYPISNDGQVSTSTENTPENNAEKNTCEQEGFFGNTQDCNKFYRCVDNSKGGYTKYEFNCGERTIWDQDLLTCNHPEDVSKPSCKETHPENTSSTEDTDTNSATLSISSSSNNSTIEETTQNNGNTHNSSCTTENSNNELNHNVKCEKAGYFADPNDCKKFYRCVDWDGNGEKFSVFHFECGEGTIWDPKLETCNHEDSVYPPRNCSAKQNENNTQETTTTQKSTTEYSSTTSQSSTDNNPTHESTTSDQTTHSTTTTEITNQSTTESETQSTTENTTTLKTTTPKEITTTESTTQEYSSEKTSQITSLTEESTTMQSNDSTTTQQSSTEITECENSSLMEQQSSTTEQITTTTDRTDETPLADTITTEKYSPTTENDQISTTETVTNKDCPKIEDDQYLYACPTSFRRHPRYCNMFYQCLEDEDNHELKIATFTCPNNTIYDENKVQCVEEEKAEKKCDGQKARKFRVKRLKNFKEPIEVDRNEHKCKATGNYGFDTDTECSRIFLKCLATKSGKLRGFVYQCPEGYIYWKISKRCEKTESMKYCQISKRRNWSNRWEIPIELKNIAK